ncbi:MAG: UTP--glucose-1-phosphate uridylyltransferase, partial [Chlamydiia bacterium]|nr:UTP--glucose-1-phosphate uridylyltransferase [Chlamydiia bacterium]
GHGNFGLSKEQLSFFVQGELPFLSESGEPLVKEDGSFVMGPDGNGKCLHALATSGILQKWKERGVQYINIILVDNPLAVPFDAELLGWHAHLGGDVVVKCVPRDNPEEKVGVLVSEEEKIKVIEYSEMPKEAMRDTAKYPYANISLFSVTMDFAEKVANKELPLHKAYKPAATNEGIVNGWKFEYFIFDFLPFASAHLLVYPRSEIFAPLKAKEGSNSPEEVKKSLEAYERTLFESVTGLKAPKGPLELDAQFYYPTPALKGAWKSAPLADGGFIPSKV